MIVTLPPKMNKFKVVTGADSGYFYSLLTLIQTLRTVDTENQFFLDIWDLGLEPWQTNILSTMLNSRTSVKAIEDYHQEPFPNAFNNQTESFSWKPFCIRTSLLDFQNVLWLDAGVAISGKLDPVFSLLMQQGFLFFDNFERKNIDWTSRECLELMEFQTTDFGGLQISANMIGFTNSKESLELIDEWIQFCSLPESMFSADPNHRHDQSVLSILIHRRNLPLAPFSRFAHEGPDFKLAVDSGITLLAHRRSFNWFDANFLVNFYGHKELSLPTLTIVTTTLNDLEGFKKTTHSIPKSFAIEWVVVDGGSDASIIREVELIAKEKCSKFIFGPDKGIFEGLNKAIDVSTGEFLLFLNGGDVIDEGVDIEKVLSEIRLLGDSWGVGQAFGVNSKDEVLWRWPSPSSLKLILGINSYCHQATVVSKKSLVLEGKFFEDSIFSDWVLSLLLKKRFGSPKNLESLRIRFLVGGISSTQTIDFWVSESSRLRKNAGIPIFGINALDLFLQKIAGKLIRTKRGQLIRPDLREEKSDFQKRV